MFRPSGRSPSRSTRRAESWTRSRVTARSLRPRRPTAQARSRSRCRPRTRQQAPQARRRQATRWPDTWSLLMVDEKQDDLYVAIAVGDKAEALKNVRLKMGEGIAG